MVSVPSTHLILFIASIAVAASVAGAFTAEASRLSETFEEIGFDRGDDDGDPDILSTHGGQGNDIYYLDVGTGNNTPILDENGNEVPSTALGVA